MQNIVLGIMIVLTPSVLGTAWLLWRATGMSGLARYDQDRSE